MARESFEDRISRIFNAVEKKAPKSIWSEIENHLNAEMVDDFNSSRSAHKWVSVAAIFIAICSLAVHVMPEANETTEPSPGTIYNALLSNSSGNEGFYTKHMLGLNPDALRPLISNPKGYQADEKETESFDQIPWSISGDSKRLVSIRPEILVADVKTEIYPFHSAYYYAGSARGKKSSQEKLVWAGIEAGAGNYGATNSANGLIGNINTSSLASVVGADGFTNPSTSISPSFDEGISTSIGLDFGMKLGSKWTLESGLAYTNINSNGSANIQVQDTYSVVQGSGSKARTVEVTDSYNHNLDLKNNIQLTSIPLKAGYFVVDERMSLRLNAGLAANYLVSNSISDNNSQIISGADNAYNSWSFDGIGGLEIGYRIFDQFNFTIEPNYRYALSPLNSSFNAPSRFVLQTGLRYTIK